MSDGEVWNAWDEYDAAHPTPPLSDEFARGFVAGFAAGEIHALEQASEEIYNGAPDPCQAFYDYGLHPWLMDRAKQLREDSQ